MSPVRQMCTEDGGNYNDGSRDKTLNLLSLRENEGKGKAAAHRL